MRLVTPRLTKNGRLNLDLSRYSAVLAFVRRIAGDAKRLAVKTYKLWRETPSHPSLYFRPLQGESGRFTIRIGAHYRALAEVSGDVVTWVWIATHAEYNRLVDHPS